MILCLDLETTGLNEQQCGLFEIGAVWLHGGEFFRACRPQPLAVIEPEALAVNGRTEADAKDPKRLPEALAVCEFLGWARGAMGEGSRIQIAAWNAHFDHRHLCAAIARAGVTGRHSPFAHRLIDLHSLVAGDVMRKKCETLMRGGSEYREMGLLSLGDEIRNSDDGSQIMGLAPEAKPHNALTGAKQVRAMLRRFLGDSDAQP